jgi:hypothetical protein
MKDRKFRISPPGIVGMHKLARYLDELKRAQSIGNWHRPFWWRINGSSEVNIKFENTDDAARAKLKWDP